MYLWNIDKLVNDFKDNKVTEKDRFQSLLFIEILLTFAIYANLGIEFSYLHLVEILIGIVTCVWGVTICYKANASGDNYDFLGRFTCLSIPLVIRMILIILGLATVFGLLNGIFHVQFPIFGEKISMLDVEIQAVLCVWMYWWQSRLIKKIAHKE